jgi:hypothetical protein
MRYGTSPLFGQIESYGTGPITFQGAKEFVLDPGLDVFV